MKPIALISVYLLIFAGLLGCQPVPSTPTAGQLVATTAASTPSTATASTSNSTPTSSAATQLIPSQASQASIVLPLEDISSLPSLADLKMGWNKIDPGGNTSCAYGGTYSFSVLKTNSDKLLIYFEGGGSCFSAETCAPGSNAFDGSIDYEFPADNPALKNTGVFALTDERNPFKGYNIVFINYCTGDGHSGKNTVTYQKGGQSFDINHYGAINARTVLSWTYQNFTQPKSFFMMGCSAGVGGSFFHAPYILEQYKGIPSALVGDSGGGFMNGPDTILKGLGTDELLANWLPQYDQLIKDGMISSKFIFSVPVLAYPNTRFALLDTQGDHVQAGLLAQFGITRTLAQVLHANLNEIRAEAPALLSYTGPGDYHCLAETPTYYDYEVGGVRINDWMTALVNGQPVQSVSP